ncbi:MAG: cytochrome-c peroxidase [Acidobacteriota bacterium]
MSLALFAATVFAGDPPALSTVPVPSVPGISDYIKDQAAAIRLGKALFWDMQVGSDGVQACATCHFQGGADIRSGNTLNPGANGNFSIKGANGSLSPADFPFHKVANPDSAANVVSDSDDIVGAQGLVNYAFTTTNGNKPRSRDAGTLQSEPVFQVAGKSVRQVTGRNAPSTINAVYYFNNFWDGRASNTFNGVNPFGAADTGAHVWANTNGSLAQEAVALRNSSLASQAVGPPNNPVEMAFNGRTFPELGRKMLGVRPLAKQLVHPSDSVLGNISAWPARGVKNSVSYKQMIKDAFADKYWNSSQLVNGHSQMEANFSLFWGLAVQAYERTLISDQSKYDLAQLGQATLTAQEEDGLGVFTSGGTRCANCHAGAEFSDHTVSFVQSQGLNPVLPTVADTTANGRTGTRDAGFHNIGVRPTAEDTGRGGNTPFGGPLSFTLQSGVNQANAIINGTFKTPTLRNVELSGPYFHDGSVGTLKQVVDFYTRGGNFGAANAGDLSKDIGPIGQLSGDEDKKNALVAFLLTLTDPRVKNESAPFDHPQLFLAVAAPGDDSAVNCTASQIEQGACDQFVELPPTGQGGRTADGRAQLTTFMNMDPFGRNGELLAPSAGTPQASAGPKQLPVPNVEANLLPLLP